MRLLARTFQLITAMVPGPGPGPGTTARDGRWQTQQT